MAFFAGCSNWKKHSNKWFKFNFIEVLNSLFISSFFIIGFIVNYNFFYVCDLNSNILIKYHFPSDKFPFQKMLPLPQSHQFSTVSPFLDPYHALVNVWPGHRRKIYGVNLEPYHKAPTGYPFHGIFYIYFCCFQDGFPKPGLGWQPFSLSFG